MKSQTRVILTIVVFGGCCAAGLAQTSDESAEDLDQEAAIRRYETSLGETEH